VSGVEVAFKFFQFVERADAGGLEVGEHFGQFTLAISFLHQRVLLLEFSTRICNSLRHFERQQGSLFVHPPTLRLPIGRSTTCDQPQEPQVSATDPDVPWVSQRVKFGLSQFGHFGVFATVSDCIALVVTILRCAAKHGASALSRRSTKRAIWP
jgi:hypothetical protein